MSLLANKRALEAKLKQETLSINSKEINFLVDNFTAVLTQAALIAGFSFAGLDIEIPDEANPVVSSIFRLLLYISLCLMIHVIVNACSILIWAPGQALRGKDVETVSQTVLGMIDERNKVFKLFGSGIIIFLVAAMCLAWVTFHTPEAALATIILFFSLWHYYNSMKRIHARFKGGYESLLLQANQSGDPSKYGLGIYGADIDWDEATASASSTWSGIKSKVGSTFASGLAATGISVGKNEKKKNKEAEAKEREMEEFDFGGMDLSKMGLSDVNLSSLIGENGPPPKTRIESYLWTTLDPKGGKRKSLMPSHQKQWHRYYVVGRNGTLDFYRKKKDYLQNDNAINATPLQLSKFDAIWSSEEGSFGSNENVKSGLSGPENMGVAPPSMGASQAITTSQVEVRNALRHLITGSQDTGVREWVTGNNHQRRHSHDAGKQNPPDNSPERKRTRSNSEDGNKTVQALSHLAFHLTPLSSAAGHAANMDATHVGAVSLLSASTGIAGDMLEFRAETDAEYELWLEFLKPFSALEKAKRDGTPATFEDILEEMIAEPSLEGRDHKANFVTHRNVIEGKRLLFWLLDNEWCSEQLQAGKVLQCMLERSLISCISQASLKSFKPNQFYRLKGMDEKASSQTNFGKANPRSHDKEDHSADNLSSDLSSNADDLKMVVSPRTQEEEVVFPSSDDVETALLNKRDGQNASSAVDGSDDDVDATRRRASSATLIAGWLLKRGRDGALGVPSWKRRYFVVMGSEMRYYRTQSDFERRSDPIKNRPIELKGYAVFSVRDNPCGIVLKPAMKTDQRRIWELQTESIAEQVTWVQQLRDVIRNANDEMNPSK